MPSYSRCVAGFKPCSLRTVNEDKIKYRRVRYSCVTRSCGYQYQDHPIWGQRDGAWKENRSIVLRNPRVDVTLVRLERTYAYPTPEQKYPYFLYFLVQQHDQDQKKICPL